MRAAPTMMCRTLVLLLCSVALCHGGEMAPPPHAVWPQPASLTSSGSVAVAVTSALQITAAGDKSDIVDAAINRYRSYLFGNGSSLPASPSHPDRRCEATAADAAAATPASTAISALIITVANASVELTMGTDESYVLDIPAGGVARLTAPTAVGALRGLETFSQLAGLTSTPCVYSITQAPIKVEDAPRYTHRGLLVDTGRDYYSVAKLKQIIETMAWNKLSVLHWHVTEVDSFPLQLQSVPQLAEQMAFSKEQVYSAADVAEIVAWGRLMGVRIMPEVDCPGHMTAWGLAMPELNLTINTGARHGQLDYGIANFASPHLIPMVTKVVKEVSSMFPDVLFFFGGDETACPYNECDYKEYPNQTARCPHMHCPEESGCHSRAGANYSGCPPSGWMEDPGTVRWATEHSTPGHSLLDHAALFRYFADAVEAVVRAQGKTPSWW